MGVGAGVAAAAVIGAGATMYSSSQAASAQKSAAADATNAQVQMFNVNQANEAPYMQLGQLGNEGLTNNLTALTAPVTMDQATLEKTPGYQFDLSQGLKGVQNGASAQGLGNSGAAMKGAASYAQGLASSNYQQQFNDAVANQQNTYNRLMGLTGIGQNAAAGVGNAATATGQGIASNTIGAGNATAASYNAMGGAASGAVNNISSMYLANNLTGGKLFGGSGSGGTVDPMSGARTP